MTRQDLINKLRRLNTLLVIEKRSNNLAFAVRKAIETIQTWPEDIETYMGQTSTKALFVGYGPKFIKIFNELRSTGTSQLLETLQLRHDPFFCDLCEIPSIGLVMAQRMYFDRSIRSLDDLRIAYTNNVLQRIPAFGDQRLKAIEELLWKSQNAASSQDMNRREVRIFPSTTFHTISQTMPSLPPAMSVSRSPDGLDPEVVTDNSDILDALKEDSHSGTSDRLASKALPFVWGSGSMEIPAAVPRDVTQAEIPAPSADDIVFVPKLQVRYLQAQSIRAEHIQVMHLQAPSIRRDIPWQAPDGLPPCQDVQEQKFAARVLCARLIQAQFIQADDIQATSIEWMAAPSRDGKSC